MGKTMTTMRNIILALLIAAPAGAAFAEQVATGRMQAISGSECIECHMRGQPAAAVTGPQSLRIDPSLIAGGNRTTASAAVATDHSLRVGRVETVNQVVDENGNVGIGQGNGIIVSPCLMLTNFHGVYGDSDTVDFSKNHSVQFFFGKGQAAFKWRVGGSPAHWGARTRTGGGDWALVRLDKCPGKKVGWPELDLRTPDQLKNQNLTMVGIAPGQSNGSISTRTCTAQGKLQANGGLKHTCVTPDGWSASGMFSADNRLAAIHVGELGADSYGVSMAEIFSDSEARALIEADKAQFAYEQNLGPVHASLTSGRAAML